MIKLRPSRERYLGITEADCLEILNITPDQLRIARALDRKKVDAVRNLIDGVEPEGKYQDVLIEHVLSWLPTFDEEKADG